MIFILILFFLSGLFGLIDEIVWTRMLLLVFGSTTYSMVVVTSSFMAGLALGSFIIGKMIDRTKRLLFVYGLLEIGVGIFAIFTLFAIQNLPGIYNFFNHLGMSWGLVFIKLVLSFLILLPPTILMGATLPALVRFFTLKRHGMGTQSGLLYGVNTIGAAVGTVLSGFVLIEVFGLSKTVLGAAIGNIFIGLSALVFNYSQKNRQEDVVSENLKPPVLYDKGKLSLLVIIFGISGAVSMAYEIVWVRLLTPSTGTYIYAFSIILSLFLLGISLGSLLAKFIIRRIKNRLGLIALIEAGIGVMAVLSLVVTSEYFSISMVYKVILVTLPATVFMGMTFPLVISCFNDEAKAGSIAGMTYFANTLGSIAGPVIAGFILMPYFGTTRTILFLACGNFVLSALLFFQEKKNRLPGFISLGLSVVLILVGIFSWQIFWEKSFARKIKMFKEKHYRYMYLEDESAAVLAYRSREFQDGALLVDGISMTGLSIEPKLMAHLPLFLVESPKKALVIAFGMGTTFRSALTHGVSVDTVELIPSVPKTFEVFHSDASQILKNPNGRIIINDGRNFVFSTKEKYDVITVDPPPPLNSANTTLLYSREFYRQAIDRLTDKGIFLQWLYFYDSRRDDIGMLVKSFTDVFPFVSVWQNPNGWGLYLMGSKEKVTIDRNLFKERYAKKRVFEDLNEWNKTPLTLDDILRLYRGDKEILIPLTANSRGVTDDHPKTEYFLLRHSFLPSRKVQFVGDLLGR